MLYSIGTPILSGFEDNRETNRGVCRCDKIRDREWEERLVGSRASWWFRIAIEVR